MACIPIAGNGFKGWICGPDYLVNLEKYGAKRIWMSFHKYLGPTFYHGKEGPIVRNPGQATWDAFSIWHKETFKKGEK